MSSADFPPSPSSFVARALHRRACRRHRARLPTSCRRNGNVLLESLFCIALVGIGAIPLAILGGEWLRWSGEDERLTATLQLAAEQAEAGIDPWPLVSGDSQRVALCDAVPSHATCAPGKRLAIASTPPAAHRSSDPDAPSPAGIALWVSP